MSGEGTMHFNNGDRYQGMWKNHLMHGSGVYVDRLGIEWNGIFINGVFDSTI